MGRVWLLASPSICNSYISWSIKQGGRKNGIGWVLLYASRTEKKKSFSGQPKSLNEHSDAWGISTAVRGSHVEWVCWKPVDSIGPVRGSNIGQAKCPQMAFPPQRFIYAQQMKKRFWFCLLDCFISWDWRSEPNPKTKRLEQKKYYIQEFRFWVFRFLLISSQKAIPRKND